MMSLKLASILGTLAVILLASGVMPVCANPNAALRMTVPFAFEAGGHALPAGNYLIQQRISTGIVVLTLPGGTRHALLTFPAGDPSNPKSPRLVFEKLGETYRLAEVWVSGAAVGCRIPETKAQKLLAAKNTHRKRIILLALLRD